MQIKDFFEIQRNKSVSMLCFSSFPARLFCLLVLLIFCVVLRLQPSELIHCLLEDLVRKLRGKKSYEPDKEDDRREHQAMAKHSQAHNNIGRDFIPCVFSGSHIMFCFLLNPFNLYLFLPYDKTARVRSPQFGYSKCAWWSYNG